MGGLAMVIGSNQSLWQAQVESYLLGRVMALQNMVGAVPHLCAFVLAGVVADQVFVPLVGRNRVRSPFLAMVVGNGPGRGFALLMMVMGLLLALCVVLAYLYPRLRHVDDEIPDIRAENDDSAERAAVDPAETQA
jgi:DHA3 family macrolide efflux protein-like MFS transporter